MKGLFVKAVNSIIPSGEELKADFELIGADTEKRNGISRYLDALFGRENIITEFDGELFRTIVSRVTVHAKNSAAFTFINGTEITP